ncbi:uncharacterized protein BDZ83DRAFT_277457 [Colletotrichum acutatum]|uniref:Uncharacterized protein n=1 Tax=Glomerella acutata TaxID=27357 RepID=A0AAD8XJ74_GLOAC|nr:uncharacterized protein BDZ83DRAFT_277457 [Colletotrichum acutatum]KAK1725835.1 hypothetical protein BDZ83DRAFT_277457 [Colletotrichum acutatum]
MVVREADVTEKLGSVKEINDDFLRELHITNMNMGVKTMTKLMETSSIVEVQRSESSRHYESIHTSTGHLHSDLAVGFEGVDQSLRNILSQSGRTTGMINAGLPDLRDDVRVSRGMLQELFRQQNQHIAEERKALRNKMLSILTRPDSFNNQSSVFRWEISPQRQEELASNTRAALFRNPENLQDGFDHSVRGLSTFKYCHCRTRTKVRDMRMGPLKLQTTQKSDHRPGCQHSQLGSTSWSYTVCAILYSFLHKTMELAIGAATGPGGFFLAPPLRFRNIVRRSESEIFRSFDLFPTICTKMTSFCVFLQCT